jgi:hypothetical protein
MAHRHPDYARRARRRFCAGTRKAPIELVLSGQRSLEEWVEVLFQERNSKNGQRCDATPFEQAAQPFTPREQERL